MKKHQSSFFCFFQKNNVFSEKWESLIVVEWNCVWKKTWRRFLFVFLRCLQLKWDDIVSQSFFSELEKNATSLNRLVFFWVSSKSEFSYALEEWQSIIRLFFIKTVRLRRKINLYLKCHIHINIFTNKIFPNTVFVISGESVEERIYLEIK